MRYASVCSGVEAASLAWEPLGWTPVFFSEIEPFPCAVLAARWPDVPNLGDMTKIDGRKYHGKVDLLVGGTPCQGFSVSGKQKGLDDNRSALAMHFGRLLEEIRPKWFVWENVPGVFSTNNGRDFARFLASLEQGGYCCAWRVLDGEYVRVDGFPKAIPQRRRRVFVVGSLGDWTGPAEVLFEPAGMLGDTPPGRKKGKGAESQSEKGSDEAGGDVPGTLTATHYRGPGARDGHERPMAINRSEAFSESNYGGYSKTSESGTLRASGGAFGGGSETLIKTTEMGRRENPAVNSNGGDVMPTLASSDLVKQTSNQSIFGGGFILEKGTSDANAANARTEEHGGQITDPAPLTFPLNLQDFSGCAEKGGRVSDGIGRTDDPMLTITTGLAQAVAIAEDIAEREKDSEENAGHGRRNSNSRDEHCPDGVRRLTPLECERLFGFPDGHTIPTFKNGVTPDIVARFVEICFKWGRLNCDKSWKIRRRSYNATRIWLRRISNPSTSPDSPRYKACGNSMMVNVMRWIGMRLDIVENKNKNK